MPCWPSRIPTCLRCIPWACVAVPCMRCHGCFELVSEKDMSQREQVLRPGFGSWQPSPFTGSSQRFVPDCLRTRAKWSSSGVRTRCRQLPYCQDVQQNRVKVQFEMPAFPLELQIYSHGPPPFSAVCHQLLSRNKSSTRKPIQAAPFGSL